MYSISRVFTKINWKKYANTNFVVTMFGRFHVRPNTFDVVCVSPDFERQDIDLSINIISKLLNNGRKVSYLDIGADIGLYSIVIGNLFKNKGNIEIYGFEPFMESYDLFNKNIIENNLGDMIHSFNYGLYNKNGSINLNLNELNPGSNSIEYITNSSNKTIDIVIKQLDDTGIFNDQEKKDVLFLKLDIEGAEISALTGSVNTINSFDEVYIMVEDFVDESICTYLSGIGFYEIAKKTPYNSFWHRKNEK